MSFSCSVEVMIDGKLRRIGSENAGVVDGGRDSDGFLAFGYPGKLQIHVQVFAADRDRLAAVAEAGAPGFQGVNTRGDGFEREFAGRARPGLSD